MATIQELKRLAGRLKHSGNPYEVLSPAEAEKKDKALAVILKAIRLKEAKEKTNG